MEQMILCRYTDEEMNEMRTKVAELVSQYMAVEYRKKIADEGYNDEMKDIWKELSEIEPKIRIGGERKYLKVRREVFPETGLCRIYRMDNGELVEEREMTEEEKEACRQVEMPLDRQLPPPDPDNRFEV